MTDKSYVGMSACMYCGECKELILDARLKDSLPRSAVYDILPCDACKEKYKDFVIFVEGDEEAHIEKGLSQQPKNGGRWATLHNEDFKNNFNTQLPPRGICLCDKGVMDVLVKSIGEYSQQT